MRMRISLLAFACVLTFASQAQFTKGDRMLGASIASFLFSSGTADISVASIGSNTSKIKNYSVVINPSLGWFLTDKTVLGVSLNINPYGNKTTYEQGGTTFQMDKSTSYNLGLGLFARQYLKGTNILPFGQISLNGGFSNLKTEGFFYGGSGPTAYKITYDGNSTGGGFFNAAFTAGLTKMLNQNAGLDIFLGYTYSNNKNTFKKTTLRDDGNNGSIEERQENNTTTKFTNNGFLAGVAFQIFLKGRKK